MAMPAGINTRYVTLPFMSEPTTGALNGAANVQLVTLNNAGSIATVIVAESLPELMPEAAPYPPKFLMYKFSETFCV